MIHIKDITNWEQAIGNVVCGDCLDLMKMIPDKSIDLVLTDPPYGISADKGTGGFGSSKHTVKKYKDSWDNKCPDSKCFDELLRVGGLCIIFGGNYFTDKLPVSRGWIVWDKVGEVLFDNPYSKCELLWTSKNMVCQKYTIIQMGFISKEKERFHPTQKPIELLEYIIRDYSKPTDIIFDGFLGSGTTAVACERLGRRWIGCEISEEYCTIADKRIKAEKDQLKLKL